MWMLYILLLTPQGYVGDALTIRVTDQEQCETLGYDLTQETELMDTWHCVDLLTLLPETGEVG